MTPFESALGARFHHLQPQIRQLHGGRAPDWAGDVTVRRSGGVLGWFVARLSGFPESMDKAPFKIRVEPTENGERWLRLFGQTQTVSTLGWTKEGGLQETLGPIQLDLTASVKADSLLVQVANARIFATVLLPNFLTPKTSAKIWQDEAGRYRFDIKASFPLIGQVLHYEGWLRPATASAFA